MSVSAPSVSGRLAAMSAQHRRVQPLQQRHALAQGLVVVHLALHGALGDARHLLAYPVRARQLVDDLDADERGVHVHHHQPLAAPVEALALQRHVEGAGGHGQLQQRALELLGVALRRQGNADLDGAEFRSDRRSMRSMLAPCARQTLGHGVQLARAQGAPHSGDDMAAEGRSSGGRRIHRLEVQRHAQLLGREEQLLEDAARLGQAHQQAQGELALHHHLLDVEQLRAHLGEDAGQARGDAGLVLPGDGDEDGVLGALAVAHGGADLPARPARRERSSHRSVTAAPRTG